MPARKLKPPRTVPAAVELSRHGARNRLRDTGREVILVTLGLLPFFASSLIEKTLFGWLGPEQETLAHRTVLILDTATFLKLALPSLSTLVIDVIVEVKAILAALKS